MTNPSRDYSYDYISVSQIWFSSLFFKRVGCLIQWIFSITNMILLSLVQWVCVWFSESLCSQIWFSSLLFKFEVGPYFCFLTLRLSHCTFLNRLKKLCSWSHEKNYFPGSDLIWHCYQCVNSAKVKFGVPQGCVQHSLQF